MFRRREGALLSHLRFPGIQAGCEWRAQRFWDCSLCPSAALSRASSSWECGDGARGIERKGLESAFKTSAMPFKMFNSLFYIYSCTLSAGLAMIIKITFWGRKPSSAHPSLFFCSFPRLPWNDFSSVQGNASAQWLIRIAINTRCNSIGLIYLIGQALIN